MSTKAKVIAANASFTGSVIKIIPASASLAVELNVATLDRCSFGVFRNDGSGTTGSLTPTHEYTGDIILNHSTVLEGPISSFHVKNGSKSPVIVYYTDEV